MPASASYVHEITWDTQGAGAKGNFDLDLHVYNGLTLPYGATYGSSSSTMFDSAGVPRPGALLADPSHRVGAGDAMVGPSIRVRRAFLA